MRPKISCLSPCYRMGAYLQKFLQELPKQSIFDDMQVVLDLNDGTAEEKAMIAGFQALYPERIKLLVTEPVAPIGLSMNTCIKAANADIVTIWNVDDLRTPESLERQVTIFNQHPEIGLVHGNFTIVKEFGSTEGKFIDHTKYNNVDELTRSMVVGPFFAFRKELVEKCGMFDEQLKTGADFDMAIRLADCTKVGIDSDCLGYYLDEGKGASTKGDGRQPIERTVVELRYGILDKIEPQYLPEALKYDIRHVVNDGKKIPVSTLVANYALLQERNDMRQG